MIKKSILNGHDDVLMSHRDHSQHECPFEEMAKAIDEVNIRCYI